MIAVTLIACATALLLAGLAVLAHRAALPVPAAGPVDSLLREHLLERYVVTTATGETFSGLLAAVDDRTLVLRETAVMSTDGKESQVAGEVVLRRDAVAYMQRP